MTILDFQEFAKWIKVPDHHDNLMISREDPYEVIRRYYQCACNVSLTWATHLLKRPSMHSPHATHNSSALPQFVLLECLHQHSHTHNDSLTHRYGLSRLSLLGTGVHGRYVVWSKNGLDQEIWYSMWVIWGEAYIYTIRQIRRSAVQGTNLL